MNVDTKKDIPILNVAIKGYGYIVWKPGDPFRKRYLVCKGKRCTCGRDKCEHVQAIVRYLKNKGRRAPEDPRPTLEQRVARIRELRERCIKENTLSDATMALIMAQRANTDEERVAWIKKYSLPMMWPVEMCK